MHFFDYELPERLIAQHPAERRDESRLLVVRRASGTLEHRTFRDLPELLEPDDLLVLNDTRVLPARLIGTREATGGKWEGLYLGRTADGLWELLAQTRGFVHEGETLLADGSEQRFVLRDRTDDRHWLVEPVPTGEPEAILTKVGHIPLPPYIRKGRAQDEDAERYQTVFAERLGSVAAPTAGLHFTPELLEQFKTARVTLHVGLGTFAPVKVDDPSKHAIHREWCEVTDEACEAIRNCRGRVIAVGTTATRTLESAAKKPSPLPPPRSGEGEHDQPPPSLLGKGAGGLGSCQPFRGETGLFIHPPFDFRIANGLITNFHLPRTTLLLLVGAFAGSELLRLAYEEAIRREYRFYSYGDAMLIL